MSLTRWRRSALAWLSAFVCTSLTKPEARAGAWPGDSLTEFQAACRPASLNTSSAALCLGGIERTSSQPLWGLSSSGCPGLSWRAVCQTVAQPGNVHQTVAQLVPTDTELPAQSELGRAWLHAALRSCLLAAGSTPATWVTMGKQTSVGLIQLSLLMLSWIRN